MLTYNCEYGTMNRSDKKIEVAEMEFLRPVTGVSLLDQKICEDTRIQLNGIYKNDR